MLPYSTQQRKQRDISKGKIDGRSQEIQRLIAGDARGGDLKNSARARSGLIATCFRRMAARARRPSPAVTSRFHSRSEKLLAEQKLQTNPLREAVAAVSVGIVNQQVFA